MLPAETLPLGCVACFISLCYTFSERNGVPPSVSFERDPEKQRLEEEADSLEEYGEVDPCRFNEDGSFIGQYGENKAGEGTDPANIA